MNFLPSSRVIQERAGTTTLAADLADINAAVAGKADESHSHGLGDVTGLVTALTNLGNEIDAKADLVGGFVPTSQIPAIAISEFLGSVANEAAMLALTGDRGDWCIRADTGLTYVLKADDSSLIGSWQAHSYPAAPVTTVNGQTGVVVLGADDVGAAAEGHSHDDAYDSLGTAEELHAIAMASVSAVTSALGTMSTQAASSVNITGGTIAGITDLAIADGGTGASTASGARTNLGLVIGDDVLAPGGSGAALTGITAAQVGAQPLSRVFSDATVGYGPMGGGAGTYAQGNGVLLAYPQDLPAVTLNSAVIVVKTAGAAGSTFRVGLAHATSANRPGVLIRDFGTVAADVANTKRTFTFGSPLTLAAGWYFVLVLKDGASGSATISAASWTFADGRLGTLIVDATPELHPITWLFMNGQSGALLADYTASTWQRQVSTATPRVVWCP